jgi:hypothetical protein
MSGAAAPIAGGCRPETAVRFQAHRQCFGALVGLYFIGLLVPTLFLHRAPGIAWALYLTLSGACAAASLMLLSCPTCHRRVPNFSVDRCGRCEAPLQLPIRAPSWPEMLRWRRIARALLIAAASAAIASLTLGLRAPANVAFAGLLAAAGLALAARRPSQCGQICPRCRGRMGQGLWRALQRCQACTAPREALQQAVQV